MKIMFKHQGLSSIVVRLKKMYDKPVDTCPFECDSVPDWYVTQYLSHKLVSQDLFILKYWHDKYKTQEMCDKAVEFRIRTLKFVLVCFLTSKAIENLDSAVFCKDYTVLADLNSRWRWREKMKLAYFYSLSSTINLTIVMRIHKRISN